MPIQLQSPFVSFETKVQYHYFNHLYTQFQQYPIEQILQNPFASFAYANVLLYLSKNEELIKLLQPYDQITEGKLVMLNVLSIDKISPLIIEHIGEIGKNSIHHQKYLMNILNLISIAINKSQIKQKEDKINIINSMNQILETIQYENTSTLKLISSIVRIIRMLNEKTNEWTFNCLPFIESIEFIFKDDPSFLSQIFNNCLLDDYETPASDITKSVPIISLKMIKLIMAKIENYDKKLLTNQYQPNEYDSLISLRNAYFGMMYSSLIHYHLSHIHAEERDAIVQQVIHLRKSQFTIVDKTVKEFDMKLANIYNEYPNEEMVIQIQSIAIEANIPLDLLPKLHEKLFNDTMNCYLNTYNRIPIHFKSKILPESVEKLFTFCIFKFKHQLRSIVDTQMMKEENKNVLDESASQQSNGLFGDLYLSNNQSEIVEINEINEHVEEMNNNQNNEEIQIENENNRNNNQNDENQSATEQLMASVNRLRELLNSIGGSDNEENRDRLDELLDQLVEIAHEENVMNEDENNDERRVNGNSDENEEESESSESEENEEENEDEGEGEEESESSSISESEEYQEEQPHVEEQQEEEQPVQEQNNNNQQPITPQQEQPHVEEQQVQEENNNNQQPIAQQQNIQPPQPPTPPALNIPEPPREPEQQPVVQEEPQNTNNNNNQQVPQAQPQAQQQRLFRGQPLPEGVDVEAFFSLPEDLQEEIFNDMRQAQQQNNQPPQQEAFYDFIYDLDPMLRQDILRNIDDEMFALLPQDLQQEVRQIRREGVSFGPINGNYQSPNDSEEDYIENIEDDNVNHLNVMKYDNQHIPITYGIEAVEPLTKMYLSKNVIIKRIGLHKLLFLSDHFNDTKSNEYFTIISIIFQQYIYPMLNQPSVPVIDIERLLKLSLLLMFHRRQMNFEDVTFFYAIQPIVEFAFEKKVNQLPLFVQHMFAAIYAYSLLQIHNFCKSSIHITLKKQIVAQFIFALNRCYGIFASGSVRKAIAMIMSGEYMKFIVQAILFDHFKYLVDPEQEILDENKLQVILSFNLAMHITITRYEKETKSMFDVFKNQITEEKIQILDNKIKSNKKHKRILIEIIYSYLNYYFIADSEMIKKTIYIDRFLDKHKDYVETLLKNNPTLLKTSFTILNRYPKFLSFESKCKVFRREIRKMKRKFGKRGYQITVDRNNLFQESFSQLNYATDEDLKGQLKVKFKGEQGIDMGGLRKEWLRVIATSMFNENYALFMKTDSGLYHPNPLSENYSDVNFYRFIGKIVAKTVYDGEFLDVNFTKSMYKYLLKQEMTLSDLESFDDEVYRNLKQFLENDVTGFDIYFCVDREEFGKITTIDLIPSGRDIEVTNENKHEYAKLFVEYKLLGSVKKQLELFREGFYSIIPYELISYFYDTEFELLVSGMPDIDVDDLRANTIYIGYTSTSNVILWFWQVFEEMQQRQKVLLLQFVTGSSKVPLGGFSHLMGNNGTQLFTIQRLHKSDKLPIAHTCFNTLDLPDYDSIDVLRDKLLFAISECNEGFGIA